MSTTWNPDLYLRYAAYRARPADDLLPRIAFEAAGDIYDLGCGPGTLTVKLREKWPQRRVIGVDSSAEMLAKARAKFPAGIEWREGDIASWRADARAALVFANASLHWLEGHSALIPGLMRQVTPGGIFAMQVPVSGPQPYHKCIEAVAAMPRWRERFRDVHPHPDPLPAGVYYDLLEPLAVEVDVWETDYHHVLEGEHPVTEWISSTGLVPFLSVLDTEDQAAFIADYNVCADSAYPRQADGRVLFTMHRLFIVARRR